MHLHLLSPLEIRCARPFRLLASLVMLLTLVTAFASPPEEDARATHGLALADHTLNVFARPLEEWDVSDTLLASDIEGALHGLNRTTGEVIWTLPGTAPLVQISSSNLTQSEQLIWAVEPLEDGRLYYFSKNAGLCELPASIKHLVLESPFAPAGDDKIYTGVRRTVLYDIRVSDGEVLGTYGPNRAQCPVTDLRDRIGDHIYVGQTTYELTIHGRDDTIWNVTYTTWGPNNMDQDLVRQSRYPRDAFVAPHYDSSVVAVDRKLLAPRWISRLSAITVNVFDIFEQNEQLVTIPHPLQPGRKSLLRETESGGIFLDQTLTGSWYAMSGTHYPSIVSSAPMSQYWTSSHWRTRDILSLPEFAYLALNGVHRPFAGTTNFPDRLAIAPHTVKNLPATTGKPAHHSRPTTALRIEEADGSITSSLGKLILRLVENTLTTVVVVMVMVGLGRVGIMPPFTKLIAKAGLFRRNPNPIEIVEKMLSEEEVKRATLSAEPPAVESKPARSVTILDRGEVLKTTDAVTPEPDAGPRRRKRGSRGSKKGKKETDNDSVGSSPRTSTGTTIGTSTESSPGPLPTGNLSISDLILGYGSHGTVVYRGTFESRPVAVKRMLLDFYDVAQHEVALLQESDDHPNVVRYFCSQECEKFLYIAVELCSASLEDVVEHADKYPELPPMAPNRVLYQIACGLNHLHSLKIVHRDIKPQNILVAPPPKFQRRGKAPVPEVRTLISDFGLCKKLEADQSSFRATTANAAGTSGWRAPELLVDENDGLYNNVTTTGTMTLDLNHSIPGMNSMSTEPLVYDTLSKRKLTRAIDVFSLGCVFYYVLTKGQHPFGDRYLREGNIIKGEYSLDLLDLVPDSFEARHLIAHMIARDPRLRLDSLQITKHPYFWLYEKRFDFLLKVSDRFEVERRDPPSSLLLLLEAIAPLVVGKDWRLKFNRSFIDNLGKYRKYQGLKLMDLLRALRNKYHHFNDLPPELMVAMGPIPEGFYGYFNSRFPNMLMEIYFVVQENLAQEPTLMVFF